MIPCSLKINTRGILVEKYWEIHYNFSLIVTRITKRIVAVILK